MKFVRATEDVIVVYELGLVGLYAGLSKALRRGRRVVSLVEGDYQHLGRTGTAAFKLPVRRLAARLSRQTLANRFSLWSRWQLPALRSRLSRNLALPATRQPGTAGKHGVRPKRSWLERERQKRPSLVRKAKADRNAGGVFRGIHRCGGARYRRRTVAGSALRCSRAVLTIHTEHRSWTEEEVR